MKKLVLEIENSIFDKITAFLELIPKDKLKIYPGEKSGVPEENATHHIDYVDDIEQNKLESILSEKDCFQAEYKKTIEFDL